MVSKNNRTQRNNQAKVIQALENIYISPTELCNLACRHCYTKKTKHTLSNKQILNFVDKYSKHLNSLSLNLKSILFCGGELFLLPKFTHLVNQLVDQKIFITIISNGTIDKLNQIKHPSACQLLVSLDGPKHIHDQNRGGGNFDKSIKFIKHAISLNFPTEIFFLITKNSYPYIDSFQHYLTKFLSTPTINLTYLTDRLESLTPKQVLNIKRNYPTYPTKNFGCFQLALQSNGSIYGCCESSAPLAKITDSVSKIIEAFSSSLSTCINCSLYQKQCFGCTDPNFLCNYTLELNCQTCQQTIKKITLSGSLL